jgi:hypothetical protein
MRRKLQLANREFSYAKKKRSGYRKIANFTIFCLLAFLLAVAPVKVTFATSVWDGLQTTSTLNITSGDEAYTEDVTHTFMDTILKSCGPIAYEDFMTAMDDPNGRMAVLQTTDPMMAPLEKRLVVGWSTNSSHITDFYSVSGNDIVRVPVESYVDIQYTLQGDLFCYYPTPTSQWLQLYNAGYNIASVYNSTYPVTYPSGYAGPQIPNRDDLDGDGLMLADEITQGTSDLKHDTDEDGLTDYIESNSFPDRDDVFCDKTVSPYVCSYPHPLFQDLYVEIDWMSDGTNDYEPNSTQLGMVTSMFGGSNMFLHLDTGQYGGGGQEISIDTNEEREEYLLRVPKTGVIDYYDYRNGGDSTATGGAAIAQHFSPDRENIWRYMIIGHKQAHLNDQDQIVNNESSGWAQTLGVNSFVSWKRVVDFQSSYTSFDTAMAGTIAHEIGHLLCLSDDKIFVQQPDSCVYQGIDNDSGDGDINNADAYYNMEDYESVMNYRYQLNADDTTSGVVNYSDGSHGTDDHDDWSAVYSAMGRFSGTLDVIGQGRGSITSQTPSHERPIADEEDLNS